MDPIQITLSVEAQEVVEQIQSLASEAKQAFEQQMASAVDRYQSKLHSLTEEYRVQEAVIKQNADQIGRLEQAKRTASDNELKRIESEISALKKLNEQRQSEIAKIEEKKTVVQGSLAAAQAATDKEKLNIQLLTQAKLIDLQATKDQEKAAVAAGIAAERAAQQAAVAAEKQADATAKANERAWESANKASAKSAEASQKAADKAQAEIDKLMAKEAAAKEATIANLDSLNRKQTEADAVIEGHKKKIEELQNRRLEESSTERKATDQEIENIKKLILSKESEIATIQKKRLALEEEARISQATSEAEINAIKREISERRVSIDTTLGQQKAHQQVNETVEEGTSTIGNYFQMFSGVGAVMFSLNSIKQVLEDNKNLMEAAIAAGEKLRGVAGSQYDKLKQYYHEQGLGNADEQRAGASAIDAIHYANNVEQSVAVSTASAMAGPLKRNKITDVQGDRYQGLVGNAARFVDKGLDPTLVSDFTEDALRQNKNLTGDELNQQLANVLGATDGSPSRANELLRVYQEDKSRFQAAGFGQDDVAKVFQTMKANGISEHQIPTLAKQYFQGMDRLLGMSPEQLVQAQGEMSEFSTSGKMQLENLRSLKLSPAKMLAAQERLRTTGVPELDAVFNEAVKSGKIDIRHAAEVISGLSPEKRDRAARILGGSRGTYAANAAAGWTKATSATGSKIGVSDNADQRAKVLKELSDASTASRNVTDPYGAKFTHDVENETAVVERRSSELMDVYERHPTTFKALSLGTMHIASKGEIAAARVIGREFYQKAQLLNDIRTGKIKATPEQQARLKQDLDKLLGLLEQSTQGKAQGIGQSDAWHILADGANTYEDGKTTTPSDILSEFPDSEKFIDKQLNSEGYETWSESIKDDRAVSPILKDAATVERELKNKPTTKPSSPTSINYHIRQVNYGYGMDSIGAPASTNNRYG